MTRGEWWFAVGLLIVALLCHSMLPRYDWRAIGNGLVRRPLDRSAPVDHGGGAAPHLGAKRPVYGDSAVTATPPAAIGAEPSPLPSCTRSLECAATGDTARQLGHGRHRAIGAAPAVSPHCAMVREMQQKYICRGFVKTKWLPHLCRHGVSVAAPGSRSCRPQRMSSAQPQRSCRRRIISEDVRARIEATVLAASEEAPGSREVRERGDQADRARDEREVPATEE